MRELPIKKARIAALIEQQVMKCRVGVNHGARPRPAPPLRRSQMNAASMIRDGKGFFECHQS